MKNKTFGILSLLTLLIAGCGSTTPDVTVTFYHETKFGGAMTNITIDDFNAKGFEYGDSLDIRFSNGTNFADVPYYSGYYTRTGSLLVVAYPGFPGIKICFNNGDDLYTLIGAKENDTVELTLRERGKYLSIQNALGYRYSDGYATYNDDVVFANARVMNYGNLKENMFYRSASPCDNQHNRAPYSSKYMQDNNISYIFDLADSEDELETYNSQTNYDISYWKELYANDKVLPLSMPANYRSADFKEKTGRMFKDFLNQDDGKFLIHCTEGKDRTGFICMLIECLGGCSYEEIAYDYMLTYSNYYEVTKESNPDSYEAFFDVMFIDLFDYIVGVHLSSNIAVDQMREGAENYLVDCGLDDEEIDAVIEKITK